MYYNANGGIGCNDRFTVKLREKQADGSYRQVDDFPPMVKLVERMRKMPECKGLMARMDMIYQLYPIIKTMVECGRVPDLSQYEMMKEYKHYDELAPIVCNHTLTDHKGVLDIGFAHIKGGVTSAGFTNYGWHEQTHAERVSSQEVMEVKGRVILYHSTSSEASEIIRESGFRTDLPDNISAGRANRFGQGVYLSSTPTAALAERPGGVVLEVETFVGKNLDITSRGPIDDIKLAHSIARGARKHGYDSITTQSLRSSEGTNTVVFDPGRTKPL